MGFISNLFRGGAARRQQEEEQQQQVRAVRNQLREMQVRIHEQERELEEKRRTKANHLAKWDRLEREHQVSRDGGKGLNPSSLLSELLDRALSIFPY